jgi:hypothetical protein
MKTNYNFDDCRDCVAWGMDKLRTAEKQTEAAGKEWLIATETCKWAIEQAICNRGGGPMIDAVKQYVRSIMWEVGLYDELCRSQSLNPATSKAEFYLSRRIPQTVVDRIPREKHKEAIELLEKLNQSTDEQTIINILSAQVGIALNEHVPAIAGVQEFKS